jgi:magnesium chelatase subunit I
MTPSSSYVRLARETPGMDAVIKPLGGASSPAATASAVEFVLEGLHLNRRLNKDRVGGGARYRR